MASFPWSTGARAKSIALDDAVCVIGLGRFGSALALELMADGVEVLGIDANHEHVQSLDGQLTHVVRGDSTKEETLRALSVHEFSRVVVAIGSDLQASILTTSLLLKFGVPSIWAKAVSAQHGEILQQLGVEHVVYPESDMGRRVAHLVRFALQDFIEIGDDFVFVKNRPPQAAIGLPLGDLELRRRYGVSITAVKKPGRAWTVAQSNTVLGSDDLVLVAGTKRETEAFMRLEGAGDVAPGGAGE